MSNLERWAATGIIDSVPSEMQENMANALENQRIFNENGNNTPSFMRMSIPLVIRVLNNLNNVKIVSSLTTEFSEAYNTSLVFDVYNYGQKVDLDYEVEWLVEFAEKVVAYLENLEEINFKAFGVNEDGFLMVYGDLR